MENNILNEEEGKQLETIMHEIHTSLNSIISTMGDISRLDLTRKEVQNQAKEKILDVANYAESIRMYLNYWQLSNSSDYFKNAPKRPIDLWWLFTHPNAYFLNLMRKKKIEYNTEKSENIIPSINGYPILNAIVNILLDNAVKYSPVGGEILCQFETTRFDLIINLENDGPYLSEDEIETITNHGNRGRNAIISETNGHGYGLNLLEEIIYNHGGELQIESLYSSKVNGIPYGKFICHITLPRSN
ncbi:HAMP domain-containing sensor histidine kinase [Bacteroides sp. 224]|uniref:sensor histidine kinase n=1 Tax=Bacteroides sp. 224 TaxID=2302936 RepID=UPI0013D635A4|nr:HAMP domain-containing sensor histidine kinase [Bacteroides sp. 224]NDV67015.1 sensor histidine kinase [Bacteroides sp. 224]